MTKKVYRVHNWKEYKKGLVHEGVGRQSLQQRQPIRGIQ